MSIEAVASGDSVNAILAQSNQKPMPDENGSPTAGTLMEAPPEPTTKVAEKSPSEKVDQPIVPATNDENIAVTDERISARLAAIAREKRILFEREQKFKEERAEFDEYKKARENAKEDPIGFLEKSGLKLEDVIYSGLGSKPEKTVEDRIKELQDRLEQKERDEKIRQEQSEQERISQSINGFKNDINKHIEANPEKYELINLKGAQHEVYSLIEAYLQKTSKAGNPVLMSIEEAADKIEQYYEQHETEIFSKSKKLASKYKSIQDTPKQAVSSPTLTNKNAITTSAADPQETFINFEQKREASLRKSAQLLQELLNKRQ